MTNPNFKPSKELATDPRLILAVQTALLDPALLVTGFHFHPGESALHMLRGAGQWFGPRNMLEQLPSFRQIIPYTVIVWDDHEHMDENLEIRKVLAYTRTTAGGEERLHGKTSIGVGGHIDVADSILQEGRFMLDATLRAATLREVQEEIGDVEEYVSYRKWAGLLIDQDNPVGQVHIGAVNIWYMKDRFRPSFMQIEDALGGVKFRTIADIKKDPNLETWSALLLEKVGTWL